MIYRENRFDGGLRLGGGASPIIDICSASTWTVHYPEIS